MKCMKLTALIIAAALLLSACGAAPAPETAAPEQPEAAAPAPETETVDSPDLEGVYQQFQEKLSLPEMAAVSEKRRDAILGIAPEDCLQAVTVLCGDSVRADEIWMIEAADDAAADRIAELAQVRLDQRAQEMENYLPDQYQIVKQAKIVREGRFVGLFVSPDADAMEELFRAAIAN